MQSNESASSYPSRLTPQLGISQDINIPYIMGIIRRNWWLPFLFSLIGLTAALVYIAITPSLYKSTARLLIDRSVNRYLQDNKIIDEPVLNDSETGSQIYILSSESIIVPVIRELNLTIDPEFVGPGEIDAKLDSWHLKATVQRINKLLGRTTVPKKPTEATLERVVVEEFLKRLSVYREDVPSVISVSFESEDANKAAKIVNAIVDRYIELHQESKSKSTKLAAQLLNEQLTELNRQAADAERELQEFMRTNKLVTSGKATDAPDQIAIMKAQLSISLAQSAEAKSRLDLAKSSNDGIASSPLVADNEVVLKLRTQYLEYSTILADLTSRVGKNHVASLKYRKKLEDIDAAIKLEQRRIATRFQTDYELAKSRSDQLAESLSQMAVGKNEEDAAARAKLRELEGRADTLRRSYSAVLERLNEVAKNDDTVSEDARVITSAAAPLRKSSRHALKALAAGLGLGLFLGFGGALGREFVMGVVRTPKQVREMTDCHCAIVPAVKIRNRWSLAGRRRPAVLEEYVLDAPFSRFTEAFRNARVLLTAQLEERKNRTNVICVVSAVAREGKTTIATNLAALMAANSKLRILLIDCDLHRGGLTTRLAPDAKEGLLEVLQEPSRLDELKIKKERSGLDFLPCPLPQRIANAAERLGSPEMEELIDKARTSYDFIIIEAPPVMSVVDVKMMEHFIDQFILVIEWGSTKQRLVQEALIEVEGIYERLSCVMLNNVDPVTLKTIESYKGPKFGAYYET